MNDSSRTYTVSVDIRLSLFTSQVAHQAGAYPAFHCMEPPGVLPPPSQGYPPHEVRRYPFIHLGGERRTLRVKSLAHNTMSPARGSELARTPQSNP